MIIATERGVEKMISGIHQVVDGCLVQELKFGLISNNLANINTTAFKKDVMSFHQALTMQNVSVTDFSPGPIHHTGGELDVALDAAGFFEIQTAGGVRYTRDGSFALDADGYLVTGNGDKVLGEQGPIRISGGTAEIDDKGTVLVNGGSVGTITVVDIERRELLKKEGSAYYLYQGGENDIVPAENVIVRQGYIERSNVNPTEEMIKMIESLRAFESAQKAAQCIDEVTGKLISDVGA